MFLAKPMKGCRTKYRRAEALRFAVEELRIPKAYGAWLEVGDERFNSSEIQRLYEAADGSLSDRAVGAVATRLMGPPLAENLSEKTPIPDFKEQPERATAPYNLGARCGDRR